MEEKIGRFPKNFLWGVATSAAQIEGASFEDGKGLNVWDVFSRIPGKIANGDTPDPACDSYHRMEEDVALMKRLGIQSYRFSFSWSRILPNGSGEVNPAGIAYYKRLIACLKENGIVPNATMYHWDLPYALALKGGFGNRDMIGWFRAYAQVLLTHFGREIPLWTTFNEPIAVYVGYGMGGFAPGLQDEKYARQSLHNLLLCHGETVKLFREMAIPGAQIGIVVDVWKHEPAHPGNRADEAMAFRNNKIVGFDMFLHPLFRGGYSPELLDYFRREDVMPRVEPGDFDTMGQKLDFYGLNFYNGIYDDAEAEQRRRAGGNFQDQPEYHPEALRDVLRMLKEEYHIEIPIYITENGMGQDAALGREALLNDRERIDYVRQVLRWLHKAMEEGADVRGYYLWSLLDNFEWSAGYSMRYGLHYVDFETQERIPKQSAVWYADWIAQQTERS